MMVYYLEFMHCTILSKATIKTLLNPNANRRGLYHGTACRSDCCAIDKNVNHFISVTKYVYHVSYSLTYLNKLTSFA
jgi:hypothetical protein